MLHLHICTAYLCTITSAVLCLLKLLQVSTSEVASERQSASRFKEQSEASMEPLSDQLHATMDIVLEETAEFAGGEKEAKTVPSAPDGTSQLVEQFALMLALKDAFLPAYGGVATEKGKLFTSLLGSVFAGLSIDKVINEEIEALQKAGSFTSHREMLDSVRESRAVSVLGKSVSPPCKFSSFGYHTLLQLCSVSLSSSLS